MADLHGGVEDEDEALRIAIALSLGEDPDAPPLGTPPRFSRLSSHHPQFVPAPSNRSDGQSSRGRDSAGIQKKSTPVAIDLTLSDDEDDHVGYAKKDDGRKSATAAPPRSAYPLPAKPIPERGNTNDDRISNTRRRQERDEQKSAEKAQQRMEPEKAEPQATQTSSDVSCSSSSTGPAGGRLGGLLGGLDRKKMEEERLARLNKKRKASELTDDQQPGPGMVSDPPPTLPPLQRKKLDWPSSTTALSSGLSSSLFSSSSLAVRSSAGAAASSGSSGIPSRQPACASPSNQANVKQPNKPITPPTTTAAATPAMNSNTNNTNTNNNSVVLAYPRGVVKKTWALGQPRLGDDIKIEEVLQRSKLELAVLSSFQWDGGWLVSKLDLARTRVILVAYAADEAQKAEMEANVPRERIRFCFPPMQGPIGNMHSKLMLLKYEGYLRVVVPTGNLMPYDWGDTGVMENMAFIIDLPKLNQSAACAEKKKLTAFGEDLSYFLNAQGLDDRLVDSLRNYDFSETERYAFVHTIGGSHGEENAWRRTGYCGLGRGVADLGLASRGPIEVDVVCASLGAVNDSLLTALHYACQGDSGLKEYEARTAKRKVVGDSVAVKSHTRVYFPSQETVTRSRGGRNAGGTICFQSRWHQASTFPQHVLRDCKSTRTGLLMHSKMIFVRGQKAAGQNIHQDRNGASGADGSATNLVGLFAYVGSANLSESAWGKLVKDRGTGKPKLTCRNWECGVVIRIDNPDRGQESSTASSNGRKDSGGEHVPKHNPPMDTSSASDWRSLFEPTIPVPMELPGTPLSTTVASKKPWFFRDD
ncbi:tyrosyl-DNA phosphodiesterase-domain-containing protein [Apodospora peruviana]|uniref:Tyrosyl-DNA phosphodiesterase-domain-containing protein n=1 Tax=Apodospora peruviana TaxID=516989 RepID=A0AAE0M7N7_9PEZI|nr:tyrosyl-DNA phosphodiesterase-domain-containing protein [Apodospora peruviana]